MFWSKSFVGLKLSQLQSNIFWFATICSMSSLYYEKNGCNKHSSAVARLSGLKQSMRVRRSDNYGVMDGKSFSHFCLVRFGSDLMYLIASLFPMYFISSADGVPRTEMILWTWSKKSSPGNRGVRPNSSAMMHPTDQMSIDFEYSLALRMT
jgi:hypothetical protein